MVLDIEKHMHYPGGLNLTKGQEGEATHTVQKFVKVMRSPVKGHSMTSRHKSTQNNSLNDAYQGVVDDMLDLYNHEISITEAHEAARNFIGWTQTLLEIDREHNVYSSDEQCD